MTEAQQEEFDERVGRGLVAALTYLGENVGRWPTLEDIRYLHCLLFLEAHSDIGGKYRPDSYWPQYCRFAVPRWQDVPICMLQLEDMLQTAKADCDSVAGFDQMELVLEWAARIHHRLECIHPFQDGNGRVGRALVSWMLGYYGYPPFTPPPERKLEYIDALERADSALATHDLFHADYWPHQTEALQSLIDFIGEDLESTILDPVHSSEGLEEI